VVALSFLLVQCGKCNGSLETRMTMQGWLKHSAQLTMQTSFAHMVDVHPPTMLQQLWLSRVPKPGHITATGVLGTRTLKQGEGMSLNIHLCTKVVVFSESPPQLRHPRWLDVTQDALFVGSADNGWVHDNDLWSGGHHFTSHMHLIAVAEAEVVFEHVQLCDELVGPLVALGDPFPTPPIPYASCGRLLRYNADDYDVPLHSGDTTLCLDDLTCGHHDMPDRVIDTLVWSAATAHAQMRSVLIFSITDATTRAVELGYFGRVNDQGYAEYNTGVIDARRVHPRHCRVQVLRDGWYTSLRGAWIDACVRNPVSGW
jgi:hypothetical protein